MSKVDTQQKMDKSLHKYCNIIALLERIPLIEYTGNYEFLTEQTYNKKVMLYDENVSIPINKVDFSH